METLLQVDRIQTVFRTEAGEVTSVDQVSFDLYKGETVALVGESGSGKSVTALSILGLLGKNGRVKQGTISLEGRQLLEATPEQMRQIRGNEISIIFQEPMTSLNPVFSIGSQLTEGIRIHKKWGKKQAREYAVGLLKKVGISRAEAIMKEYPHALSGGMRQRVMIAMALACQPRLVIADEPTTALDVTIQAQILNVLKAARQEYGLSMLLITHDLGVVAEMADRVLVMYAGQVVEEADVITLFADPKHPYTQGLMGSIPRLDAPPGERLPAIPGTVPSPARMPEGCRFHNRCPYAADKCRAEQPPLLSAGENHSARCWFANDLAAANRPGEQEAGNGQVR
ncbi:ABC transporter ATP-binding protein [Paenibacillus sp. GYB004]|uniref:ABC transporter ATP-binding protein n=1 Tax=Paenibacillus sp. GYB004 TaxID=2994393 RepID=UPI002F96D3E9